MLTVLRASWANVPGGIALPAKLPTHSPKTLQDRAAWYKILHWRADWEKDFQNSVIAKGGDAGMNFYPLGKKQWLVEISTDMFAYQGDVICYYVDEAAAKPWARPVSFPVYTGEKKWTKARAVKMLGIPNFDEAKKQWTIFEKFRGPGDCGIRTTYAFNHGQPYMVECRAQRDCNGASMDPDTWPKLPNLK